MAANRAWLRGAAYSVGSLFALALFAACIGFAYEQVEERRDRGANHPPGRLVDVGGYRMHLYCVGQGFPTVVLDSGTGEYWLSWYKVQPQVANLTRVCSFDRAGLGWSDPSPNPRTSRVMAQELHSLLHNAGVPAPFVLAGHSLGGANTRVYASLYPDDVLGIVLIDAVHPDILRRSPPEVGEYLKTFIRMLNRRGSLMPFGISRIMGWCGTDPPEFRSMVRAVECQAKPWREIHEEWANFDVNMDQVRSTPSLGSMPVVVVSRDPEKFAQGVPEKFSKESNQAWESLQQDLMGLSSNSSRMIAKQAEHYVQIDRPDVVIEAFRKILDKCRAARPKSLSAARPNPSH